MPTYLYLDKKTGRQYEVVHKITDPAFKTVGEIYTFMGWTYAGKVDDLQNPVERQINCEGGAIISGEGVYHSGLISSLSAGKESKKQKAGVTRYTLEEILNQKEEDEDGE